jgi:2-polyprenyl-6-methoxyphenol hydroxylase-like FAD-dependent oxidoreductase
MRSEPTYDVLVIGARLAGAATAMLLARAGVRVLAVDQARTGSDTFSTHAFMRGGVIQLSRWGLVDALKAAGTPPINRTVIRYGGVEEVVAVKPTPHCDALYAPRRTVLDPLLVDAARRAGADVRHGVRVTRLLRDDEGRVTGAEVRDHDGRLRQLHARVTVGADGVRSRVAHEVGAESYRQGSHASALIGAYVSGLDVDGYQWLYAPDASAGLIPTNDGQVSVWVSVPAQAFGRLRHDLSASFHRILASVAPDWAEAVTCGRFHGPPRGFPGIAGFLRQAWGPGWALVGDASHFKDPLTAHGMTDALRDAELLADALVSVLRGATSEGAALGSYQARRDQLSTDVLTVADRVASYDWTLAELRDLLVDLSQAMRPEVAHLLDRAALAIPA